MYDTKNALKKYITPKNHHKTLSCIVKIEYVRTISEITLKRGWLKSIYIFLVAMCVFTLGIWH